MASVILDASAVLAIFLHEPGWDIAAKVIRQARISTVNVTEVLTKLIDKGAPERVIMLAEKTMREIAVPFDYDMARRAALLRPTTRKDGLSLGDRACLALALAQAAPVMTAERKWKKLELGVDIKVIR